MYAQKKDNATLKIRLSRMLQVPWLRIGLTLAVLLAGLAPIAAATLTDTASRPVQPPVFPQDVRPSTMYRWEQAPGGETRILRSENAGQNWNDVAPLPEPVLQWVSLANDDRIVFARTRSAIWRSENGGESWTSLSGLPSRPTALAVAGDRSRLLLVGTESMGIYRSYNLGQSWLPASGPLGADSPAPVAITALAMHPEDNRIIYAAAGYWLGVASARLTPLGTYISVDSGQQWFEMAGAALGAERVEQLIAVPGEPLQVAEVRPAGARIVEIGTNATVLAALESPDPAVRASAARIIGLSGDAQAAPALLARLEDADLRAGDAIAEALGRLAAPETLPTLFEGLSHDDEVVRARAAYALGLMRTESAVPQLAEMLLKDGSMVRKRAADSLASIGTPAAIEALIVPLSQQELTPARHSAMQGLERVGRPAGDALVGALSSPDPVLRHNAAEMLGWIRYDGAVPALTKALSDGNASVRAQAAWALGEIGTQPARLALTKMEKAEKDPEALEAARMALARAQRFAGAPEYEPAGSFSWLWQGLAQVSLLRWTILGLALLLCGWMLWGSGQMMRPNQS